ncbi:MAG TPA: DOMON-like domain-containing protein [Sphingomicrobium sp.]
MPSLVRHPDTPPGAIHTVEAELLRVSGGAIATFRAIGDISQLIIPAPAPPTRTYDLWSTTCFELFVAGEGSRYREYNLSPSGAWAAYEFDDYRQGMRDAEASIGIELSRNDKILTLIAKIESEIPTPAHVGLTAVVEEAHGDIRYWSTTFAPGKPDFHAAAVRSLLFDGVSAE